MASGDDSRVPPGTRDGKGRHLRGMGGGPGGSAVVLSFQDAVRRRLPRVPDEDAVTAPNGWPALVRGASQRRLSVVGNEDRVSEGRWGSHPYNPDDSPDIA